MPKRLEFVALILEIKLITRHKARFGVHRHGALALLIQNNHEKEFTGTISGTTT